jgi:hypothetical protein
MPGNLRDRFACRTGTAVRAFACFARESVRRAHQHVVAEFVQVSPITQPRSGWRNMICGSLEIDPHSERLQVLEPWAAWDGRDFVDMPVLMKTKGKTRGCCPRHNCDHR